MRTDKLITAEERQKTGSYYTPKELAATFVKRVLSQWPARYWPGICDVACGDGALLVEALEQTAQRLTDAHADECRRHDIAFGPLSRERHLDACRRELALAHVYGVDINQTAIDHAVARVIECAKITEQKDIDKVKSNFACQDILLKRWPSAWHVDIVISNPPWLGGSKISGVYGDTYRKCLSDFYPNWGGTADLSALFLRASCDYLIDAGYSDDKEPSWTSRPVIVGMLLPKVISQGDTRRSGLKPLVDAGWVIVDATSGAPWPDPEVQVHYASIVLRESSWPAQALLRATDAQIVNTSRLKAETEYLSRARDALINHARERDATVNFLRQENDELRKEIANLKNRRRTK